MKALLEKVRGRRARIGVIGMGYVGLPLAMHFGEAGFPVTGFDADPEKAASLNSGRSYIRHIAPERISALGPLFSATADFARLREMDAVIICVPTPLTENREPDMSCVEKAARDIAAALTPGTLVSLESTTYPGTTDDLVRPILEAGGLEAGRDFFLVYSPEREDPGNSRFTMDRIPKVVGGVTPRCLRAGVALYEQVAAAVVPVSTSRVAESSKLLENIYRAVNIALVNELKMLFERMGIDVWEVIEASRSKPFGFQAFYPGPGLGGHCIPIDPFYLTWKARRHDFVTRFIELAGEINTGMPEYVVGKVGDALNEHGRPFKGSRILVLGAAYKKNVDDLRESPALKIIKLLRDKKALVCYNDPYVPAIGKLRHYDFRLRSRPLTAGLLGRMDAVVIVTDHDCYDYEFIAGHAPLVVDTRNAYPGREAPPNVFKA